MMHNSLHRSRVAITISAAVALLVVGLVPVSGATARPLEKSSAATHHATRKAPATITAIALLHRTDLTKALGTKVSKVQDNGGVAQSDGSFASAAEVATKLTFLTATIYGYPNQKAASAAFQAGRYSNAKTIKGVGDRAPSE